MGRELPKTVLIWILLGIGALLVLYLVVSEIWADIQYYRAFTWFCGIFLFGIIVFIGWALHNASIKREIREGEIYKKGYKKGYENGKNAVVDEDDDR